MTFKEYQDKRTGLMNECQALIDEGKLEEYQARAKEVTDLDAKWDATKEALDNLQALSEEQRAYNVQNLTGAEVNNGEVVAAINLAPQGLNDGQKMTSASDLYVAAFAKSLKGDRLSAEESECFQMVNAYTHTTDNSGIVIPDSVASGIWDMVEDMYPLWADGQKTYVKGTYTVPISNSSTDAAWYEESTAIADGTESFRQLTLTGCELARAITVSWKLREMAIDDFIPFIQRKLAEKMGAALGYGIACGKGQPGQYDSFKPEPKGVITTLEAEADTPQIVTYDGDDGISYSDLTQQRAKVKIGKNALAYYANSETIWTQLANVKGQDGHPIMIPDPANGGITRIFGIQVKEDASIPDGYVLLGSPSVAYISNVNKEMSITTEEHAKARTADYCAYAIVDGGVLSTEAFALLKSDASGVTGATGGTGN